ncbi:MAG TPA: hypothetical protein PKA64_11580 [Myxococcota bacterium]|nr:hypothetical protein [Myxococcota bacterium]
MSTETTGAVVTVDELDDFCPTQGHGRVDGLPWYYRSRGGLWELRVAATTDADPLGVGLGNAPGWCWQGTDDFEGFVPVEVAEGLIRDLLGSPREQWPAVSAPRSPIRIGASWDLDRAFGERAEAIRASFAGPGVEGTDLESGVPGERW